MKEEMRFEKSRNSEPALAQGVIIEQGNRLSGLAFDRFLSTHLSSFPITAAKEGEHLKQKVNF